MLWLKWQAIEATRHGRVRKKSKRAWSQIAGEPLKSAFLVLMPAPGSLQCLYMSPLALGIVRLDVTFPGLLICQFRPDAFAPHLQLTGALDRQLHSFALTPDGVYVENFSLFALQPSTHTRLIYANVTHSQTAGKRSLLQRPNMALLAQKQRAHPNQDTTICLRHYRTALAEEEASCSESACQSSRLQQNRLLSSLPFRLPIHATPLPRTLSSFSQSSQGTATPRAPPSECLADTSQRIVDEVKTGPKSAHCPFF
jgi:hypothetical protein